MCLRGCVRKLMSLFPGYRKAAHVEQTVIRMTEKLTKDMERQFQGVWREFAATRGAFHTAVYDKLVQVYHCAAIEHQKVFPKYRNCNKGRDLVVLASGPTLDYYNLKQDALYLGVNKSFYANKAPLDYLFVQDYIPSAQNDIDAYEGNHCKKFYGVHYIVPGIAQSHADKAGAERYYFIDRNEVTAWDFPPDVSLLPFNTYSSVIHPAVTFALYTGARRIYLVGCDTSNGGYSNHLGEKDASKNTLAIQYVLLGWRKLKTYAETLFPETEIISVNPVGLKGLFKDVYTKEYLAANHEIGDVEVLG